MLDLDASKLLIIGVFALIFLGPKELPRVMRQVGNAVGKMRRMASEFQGQFMDAMREADMEELKKDMNKIQDAAKVDLASVDPLSDIQKDLSQSLEPSPASVSTPAEFSIPEPAEAASVTSADIAAATPQVEAPGEPMQIAGQGAEPAPAEADAAEPRRRSARPAGA